MLKHSLHQRLLFLTSKEWPRPQINFAEFLAATDVLRSVLNLGVTARKWLGLMQQRVLQT